MWSCLQILAWTGILKRGGFPGQPACWLHTLAKNLTVMDLGAFEYSPEEAYAAAPPEAFGDTSGLMPPQAPDVERNVLGAMMIDGQAVAQAIEVLPDEEAFYVPKHRKVYAAIVELFNRQEPIDLVTVQEELSRRQDLEQVTPHLLADLTRAVSSAANIEHHARILVEKAVLRRLIGIMRSRVAKAFDPGADVFELLEETEREIFSISETQVRQRAKHLNSLTREVIINWQAQAGRTGKLTGITSGFADLDDITGGWQNSDLIIIAARPSMGKCVDANTPILLSDGRVERIADVCERKEAKLLTLGESGRFHVTSPSAYINNGLKPVYTVQTSLGRMVRTTGTHPFLTRRGWVPLLSLQVGDEIAVPRKLEVFGQHPAEPGAIDGLARAILKPGSHLSAYRHGDTLVKAQALQTLPGWVFSLQRSDLSRFIKRVLASGRTVRFGSVATARQFAHLLLRFGVVARVSGVGSNWVVKVQDPRWAQCITGRPTESDILFDAISSITYAGQRPVFDLTIDGTHNFVASDVCVHNTALALNCARNAAMQQKPVPCAIFSLEMTAQQLVQRLLTAEAEVNAQAARTGRLSTDQLKQLVDAASEMSGAPIFIDDTPALGVLELRAKCRRLKAEHNIGLVILDYLQLMQGNNPKSREQEIAHISRSLKALAKELDVPVLALSQLNRSPETRTGNKRPLLSDLRESGSIEQDADLVAFIFRPELYGIKEINDGETTEGLAEVIVGKHRNGPIGKVDLHFEKSFAKFSNKAITNVHPPEEDVQF